MSLSVIPCLFAVALRTVSKISSADLASTLRLRSWCMRPTPSNSRDTRLFSLGLVADGECCGLTDSAQEDPCRSPAQEGH
jgi:hypothetical protein